MATNKNIENIIQDNMMEFSAYVLLDRALPDYRDGLKPVHRRILYGMHKMKATKFTKSANISGQVMALHPHGSSYASAVGMVQKDRHLYPLLEGKGGFGQYTSRDLAPAAERYSEMKLSPIAVDMMKNFDKNIVEFVDNYDGTLKMPEVLPVKFPSILAYSNSGIGVGFSSGIPSFNMNELNQAIINYLELGTKETLIPDFATGGNIIKDYDAFREINDTGRGSVKLRGKAEIEGNEIIITEIPYTTSREKIIEEIIKKAKLNKLNEVTNVMDETGFKGMRISVTCRKNTDMNVLLEKLYQLTPLESRFSANMNMLVDGLPKVLGVWDTIDKWIEWRRDCIVRGISYDIQNMNKDLHLLNGLEKVLLDIETAIDIIRKSSADLIESHLQHEFKIDHTQAVEVANMKLRNINEDYITMKIEDKQKLENKIDVYQDIIDSEDKQNSLIAKGLKDTNEKYATERRTSLLDTENIAKVEIIEDIPDYAVHLHLTEQGYCYKFKTDKQPTLKPGDSILKSFETNNKAEILIFADDKHCYKIPAHLINETASKALGSYLPNITKNSSIKILSYSILDDIQKMIIVAYSNNKVAKIDLDSFKGNRRILKKSLNETQELVDIITLQNEATLKLTTTQEVLDINTADLTTKGSRSSQGSFQTRKGNTKTVEMAF